MNGIGIVSSILRVGLHIAYELMYMNYASQLLVQPHPLYCPYTMHTNLTRVENYKNENGNGNNSIKRLI